MQYVMGMFGLLVSNIKQFHYTTMGDEVLSCLIMVVTIQKLIGKLKLFTIR